MEAKAGMDEATIAALLAAANAGALVPPARRAALVPAAAYVIEAGGRIAALGVDRLSPLAALWPEATDA